MKNLFGITNIGRNPTFEEGIHTNRDPSSRVSGNAYGKEVELYFFDRIRDEKKFDNTEKLVSQMNKDVETATKCIYKLIQMCYNT